jgi:hypothetical protein
MKNALPLTGLILTCCAGLFFKSISTPGTETGRWFETKALPAVETKVRDAQRLPFINLLNWQNGYQPRPTLQPLEVVTPAAAGYTAEELAEIYPTH